MKRKAKDTLTAIELDQNEVLEFELISGQIVEVKLLATEAHIIRTTLKEIKVAESRARTDYRFSCRLRIDGQEYTLTREVSTQKSFYDPWLISGLHIWFDAVDDIFDFLLETHGECRPQKKVRLALQDAWVRICPELLHPWCPLPEGGLKIEHCYRGEDCWLGAYNGASAHGGLDINHPPGTPLWAPFEIHDHYYFHSLPMGHNNNRWRGMHRWKNGAEWILQAHHMTELTVDEHQSIKKGQQFAKGAGVLSGSADHSHFIFKIHDYGETVLLDPWILFWQMYRDQKALRNMEQSSD